MDRVFKLVVQPGFELRFTFFVYGIGEMWRIVETRSPLGVAPSRIATGVAVL